MPIDITIAEPLNSSAALARRLAPDMCYRDPFTRQTCAPYHGIWQTLRLLNLISSINREQHFFLSRLYGVASTGKYPRILICGAADYGLLARVSAAYRQAGQKCDLTVLDRCPSALYFNRWYAERYAIKLRTEAADIVAYHARQAFDVVCTHSLLGFFSHAQRPLLSKALASLLRPGGKFITSQRVDLEPQQAQIRTFTESEIAAFCKRGLMAMKRYREKPGLAITGEQTIAEQQISADIRAYARHYKRFPIRSHKELKQLLRQAGFAIDLYQSGNNSSNSSLQDQPAGPASTASSIRACIVATRI